MAATNFTPISLYYSTTASAVPVNTNLVNGELAINITDGKLYYKNNGGTVTLLASSAGASGDVVGPASATDNALARFDTTTGKLIQNSVGILSDAGVLTGLTGITSSGSITFSSLTSGRVTYAGTSGLLQDSANLTFDGTNFTAPRTQVTTTGSPPASGAGLEIVGGTTPVILAYNRGTSAYLPFTQYGSAFTWSINAVSSDLVLTSTGLGIGTSSPGYKLDVEKSSDGTIGYFRRIGATVNPALTIYANETGNTVGFGTDYAGATSPAITFSIAASEKMRLDSSGNLGLGVTPSAWGGAFKALDIGSNACVSGTTSTQIFNNAYDSGSGVVYKSSSFAQRYQLNNLGQHVWYNAPSGTAGAAVTFTQAMTLDASGNLLVGTTSVLSVAGATGFFNTTTSGALKWAGAFENTNASPLGVTIRYATDANGTGNEFLWCAGNTTLRTSIRSNGGIVNYSANDVNLSDRREKTNFAPAKSYLDVICAIPVQTFNYIDQNLEDDPGLTLGVVAQDVQSVAPELVSESNWGTADDPKIRLSIYQTDLQYALMKCIQEQQDLIQSLTDRIAQLEAK